MFVQIWAIYKLSQLLGHPLLAAAIVALGNAGRFGSGAANADGFVRIRERSATSSSSFLALLWRRGSFLCFCESLPFTRMDSPRRWHPLARAARVSHGDFISILARASRKRATLPWLLALNGFGSVVGSLLATLLAVHSGFSCLWRAPSAFICRLVSFV